MEGHILWGGVTITRESSAHGSAGQEHRQMKGKRGREGKTKRRAEDRQVAGGGAGEWRRGRGGGVLMSAVPAERQARSRGGCLRPAMAGMTSASAPMTSPAPSMSPCRHDASPLSPAGIVSPVLSSPPRDSSQLLPDLSDKTSDPPSSTQTPSFLRRNQSGWPPGFHVERQPPLLCLSSRMDSL